jgi:hypothetical protein
MDGVKVTVNVNGSALAAEHSMGDVGGAIAVSVFDSEDTSLVGSHKTCDLNFAAVHFKTHLIWECRGLVGGVVNKESNPLHWLTLGEMHAELVILFVLIIIPVRTTVLKTLK